jgi:hypothetical protein
MLYDLAATPPEPGSLLESVFLLVSLRRREAELYSTEVLMNAIVLAGSGGNDYSLLDDAFRAYKDALFPFIEAERLRVDKETREALEHWSKQVFRVKPLWIAGANRRRKAYQRKGVEAAEKAEQLRQKRPHRRI